MSSAHRASHEDADAPSATQLVDWRVPLGRDASTAHNYVDPRGPDHRSSCTSAGGSSVIITTPLRSPHPTTLPLCASLCSAVTSDPALPAPVAPAPGSLGRAAGVPRLGGLGALGIAFGRRAASRSLWMSQARGSAVCCRAATLRIYSITGTYPAIAPTALPASRLRRPGRAPRHLHGWRPRSNAGARSWRATSSASPDGGFPTCHWEGVRLSVC